MSLPMSILIGFAREMQGSGSVPPMCIGFSSQPSWWLPNMWRTCELFLHMSNWRILCWFMSDSNCIETLANFVLKFVSSLRVVSRDRTGVGRCRPWPPTQGIFFFLPRPYSYPSLASSLVMTKLLGRNSNTALVFEQELP